MYNNIVVVVLYGSCFFFFKYYHISFYQVKCLQEICERACIAHWLHMMGKKIRVVKVGFSYYFFAALNANKEKK